MTRVNTIGPKNAKIFIIGEFPGKDEDQTGLPFVGTAGRFLMSLLQQVNIARNECRIGNVCRQQPLMNNVSLLFKDAKCTIPTDAFVSDIQILKTELLESKPNVILAVGNTALWALCGHAGIMKARGRITECTLVPGIKVLPIYHPSSLLKDRSKLFPTIMDLKKLAYEQEFPEIKTPNYKFVINPSLDEFIAYLKYLRSDAVEYISFDLETTIPHGHVTWIGLGHSSEIAVSFNVLKIVDKGVRVPALSAQDEIRLITELALTLECGKKLILQNAQFDFSVMIENYGIYPSKLWMDTMIAAHCCWPGFPKDLGFLVSMWSAEPAWKQMSQTDMGTYNALDVVHTFQIAMKFDKELEQIGVKGIFEFEQDLLPIAMMFGLQGVTVDLSKRDEIEQKAIKSRDAALLELNKYTNGKTINFNSPTQLKTWLYVDLKLPSQVNRQTQKLTTNEEALGKLARSTDNPVPALLIEYRGWNKLLTTYLNFKVDANNRVYTAYNITGTETGRWSSSSSPIKPYGPGSLQTIPPLIREFFVTQLGYIIIQADLVQAEAVVVAYESRDNRLKHVFATKGDIHKATASAMFQKPVEEIMPEERTIGKVIRHATNYGGGPGVLANKLQIGLPLAKELFNKHMAANPQIHAWHERVRREITAGNFITTPFGRKRRYVDQWPDDAVKSATAFRPQSTVADALNKGMHTFYHKYADIYELYLQLHDALYIVVLDNPEEIKLAVSRLRECLVFPIPFDSEFMTIDVDFKVGYSWGNMKSYKEEV